MIRICIALIVRMPIVTEPWPAQIGTVRAVLGFQIALAAPISTSSSASVSARDWSLPAPSRPIRKRDTAIPNSGASTPSTMISDRASGTFHCCQSCQNEKAPIMPIAPCAKLKTPAVV